MTAIGPCSNRQHEPAKPITAPDLKKAWFTTARRNEIALEFGQEMEWNPAAVLNLYLDGVKGQVTSGSVSGNVSGNVSGSVSGNVIKLQLAGPSKAGPSTIWRITTGMVRRKPLYWAPMESPR